jgi:hypothetical protein
MNTDLLTLSSAQHEEKSKLESIIRTGVKNFKEVGEALAQIWEKKLYADEYGTFEQYCNEKWGIHRRTAYKMMTAATVAANVCPVGHIDNESVARELAVLPKETQIEVAKKIFNTAKPVTAERVRAEVQRVINPVVMKPVKSSEPKIHTLSESEKQRSFELIAGWWEKNRSKLLSYPQVTPEGLVVHILNLFK